MVLFSVSDVGDNGKHHGFYRISLMKMKMLGPDRSVISYFYSVCVMMVSLTCIDTIHPISGARAAAGSLRAAAAGPGRLSAPRRGQEGAGLRPHRIQDGRPSGQGGSARSAGARTFPAQTSNVSQKDVGLTGRLSVYQGLGASLVSPASFKK